MAELREVRAAGGVIWRPAADGVEIALVHRPRHQDWTLPKGKLEPGELPLAAACREVWEETGVRAAPQNYLTRLRYRIPGRGGYVDKVVDYWAMRVVSVSAFTPNDEIDEVRWVGVEHAAGLLSYRHDAELVADFATRPRVTGVVVLHSPPDLRRKPSSTDLLALFQPERIVSVAHDRCRRTLEPLATRLGLPLAATDRGRAGMAALIRGYAASAPSTVVCARSDTVGDVMRSLASADGFDLPTGTLDRGDFCVLSFAGSVLAAADVLPLFVRIPAQRP